MITPVLMTALQEQFTMERQNSAAYTALAWALDNVNWPGASEWMKRAAAEESEHAAKFATYLVARGVMPVVSALAPETAIPTSDNLVQYFRIALDQEKATAEAIKTLHFVAEEAEDPQTCAMLIWFLEEQTKSEREVADILLTLGRVDKTGWLVFDNGLMD